VKVALFGGTFDPPHMAHVLSVAWVLAGCEVDAVWVLPVGRHALGKTPAEVTRRLALCRLAFAALGERVQVRDDDAVPEATGFTVDLLERLAMHHPTARFRWVVGSDVLAQTHRWHRWDEVCRRAPPIVLPRPGWPLPAGFDGEVAPVLLPDLSSSQLRADLAAGVSLAGRVPWQVWRELQP
jgi:nicotinate-nucleotide adenylyltransferase